MRGVAGFVGCGGKYQCALCCSCHGRLWQCAIASAAGWLKIRGLPCYRLTGDKAARGGETCIHHSRRLYWPRRKAQAYNMEVMQY